MSLASGGIYIILSGGKGVGRSETEDKSLNPKKVILLPPGVQAPKWEIERVEDGYILKARGAPTANIHDLVFALLTEEERPERWQIKAVPQAGKNRYIITAQDRFKGWVAPEDPYEQIRCRPLIVGPSDPPFYPPNEVFEIVRVDRD